MLENPPSVNEYERWTGLRVYTPEYKVREEREKIFLDYLKNTKVFLDSQKSMISVDLVKLRQKGFFGRVLDAGSWEGEMSKLIKEIGFDVYGLDAYKSNIKKAGRKYKDIDFRLGEIGQKLPYKDNLFDVIWAGDVIEHVYDTIKMFAEFNRVLKKGGYLIVSTPYHGIIKMIAIALFGLNEHFHPEHRHIRFYTDKSLRRILNKYGFKVEKEHYIGRIKPVTNNMLFISRKVNEIDQKAVPEMVR